MGAGWNTGTGGVCACGVDPGGSASLSPGGLGSAEASSAALLVAVTHTQLTTAVAATLLIRLCTLWFGVCVEQYVMEPGRKKKKATYC